MLLRQRERLSLKGQLQRQKAWVLSQEVSLRRRQIELLATASGDENVLPITVKERAKDLELGSEELDSKIRDMGSEAAALIADHQRMVKEDRGARAKELKEACSQSGLQVAGSFAVLFGSMIAGSPQVFLGASQACDEACASWRVARMRQAEEGA